MRTLGEHSYYLENVMNIIFLVQAYTVYSSSKFQFLKCSYIIFLVVQKFVKFDFDKKTTKDVSLKRVGKHSAHINKIRRIFQEFISKNVFFKHYENIHQVQNKPWTFHECCTQNVI